MYVQDGFVQDAPGGTFALIIGPQPVFVAGNPDQLPGRVVGQAHDVGADGQYGGGLIGGGVEPDELTTAPVAQPKLPPVIDEGRADLVYRQAVRTRPEAHKLPRLVVEFKEVASILSRPPKRRKPNVTGLILHGKADFVVIG